MKAMTNLDRLLKSRDITLLTKVCIVKAMVFPAVICGWECWTIQKAECLRIDGFELWCWIRLLRVPWTARSNQSVLIEINPEYSLEGPMLNVPWCQEPTHWKRPWCWEGLRARGEGATEDEMFGWYHQLKGHEFEQTLVERGQRRLVCCSYGVTNSWTQLSNQTTNIIDLLIYFLLLDPRIYLCIPSI